MDKSLERARQAELNIQKIIDYIFERCKDAIDGIQEGKERGNSIEIQLGYVYILMKLFYAISDKPDKQYAEEMSKEAGGFWTILKYFIAGKVNDIWPSIGDGNKEPFFYYCYFIKQSIFNCIYIGYPGGISYLEFVENILGKSEITSTEQQRKKLSDRFKVYLSKLYNSKKDYIRIILSERMTHESVADKNRSTDNDTYEFGPILLYERIAYEFEFFMRKKNQTKNMQIIIDQIDKVARERIEAISTCNFPENFRDKQNRYARLVKIPIAKMTDEELKDYRKYIRLKRNYIRKYAQESPEAYKYMYIEESKLFQDLLLGEHEEKIYGDKIWGDKVYEDQKIFDIIGRA